MFFISYVINKSLIMLCCIYVTDVTHNGNEIKIIYKTYNLLSFNANTSDHL